MILFWIVTFIAGGLGISPWLMHESVFSLTIAFWLTVGIVGFSGILSYVTEPKVPSDIFKSR